MWFDDDDEVFLWNSSTALTNSLALFTAGTIARDSYRHKSPTRRNLDLNLLRT